MTCACFATDLQALSSDALRRRSTRTPAPATLPNPVTEAAPTSTSAPPKRKKAEHQPVLSVLKPMELTSEHLVQRDMVLQIAKALGYACMDVRGLEMDLAQQIFSRMTNRLGKAIFQVIEFAMSFPRQAALQLFPSDLQQGQEEDNTTVWCRAHFCKRRN